MSMYVVMVTTTMIMILILPAVKKTVMQMADDC